MVSIEIPPLPPIQCCEEGREKKNVKIADSPITFATDCLTKLF